MTWDDETQMRLDQLRSGELAGTLTSQEQTELSQLMAIVEADEVQRLAPAMTNVRQEQALLRERLQELQAENEDLARLVSQQEQLAADARHWLALFEQRHQSIRQSYIRLTGELLTVAG
ncbi:MAG: hypothetical protein AB1791_09055 [Chloroflexota bacterium]